MQVIYLRDNPLPPLLARNFADVDAFRAALSRVLARQDACRNAVLFWLLAAPLPRDLALLVARLVWASRDEDDWDQDGGLEGVGENENDAKRPRPS